jgi:hypothetical protein
MTQSLTIEKIGNLFKAPVFFNLVFSILVGALIDDLGFPSSIIYLLDFSSFILTVFLLLFFVCSRHSRIRVPIYISITLFLFSFSVLIGIIINFKSLILTFYGLRTVFRFIVFFLACFLLLDSSDISKIFNIFFFLQILNFIFALYQFFGLGLYEDNLGGVFGHGNGPVLNVFQILLIAYFYHNYMSNKKGFWQLLFCSITSIIIAGMAEEKTFFYYFIVLLILEFIFNKFSIRNFLAFILSFFVFYIGFSVLSAINDGDTLATVFNWRSIIDYANNSYGISRINPFSYIYSSFFGNNLSLNLFGYGLGNCDFASSFPSDFYLKYSYTNYNFFTHSYLILSTGYVGFILYCLFLLECFFGGLVSKNENQYSMITSIMAIILFVSMMSGPVLIINQGYICYFSLAIFGVTKNDCCFAESEEETYESISRTGTQNSLSY